MEIQGKATHSSLFRETLGISLMFIIKETKPQSIEELTVHVSEYARTISKEDVYKAVKDIYVRAGCCSEYGGGAFEPMLKSYKRRQ